MKTKSLNIPLIKGAKFDFCPEDSCTILNAAVKIIDHEKVLVVDYYNKDHVLIGRSFFSKNDYRHMVIKDGITKYNKLLYDNAFPKFFNTVYINEKTKNCINKFFKNVRDRSYDYMVTSHIDKIRAQQEEQKRLRKLEAATLLNDTVTNELDLDGLHRHFNNEIPHFTFFVNKNKKERECECTHCKEVYETKTHLKHLDEFVCEKCGHTTTLQNKKICKSYFFDINYTTVIEKVPYGIVIRYILHERSIRKIGDNLHTSIEMNEVARRFSDENGKVKYYEYSVNTCNSRKYYTESDKILTWRETDASYGRSTRSMWNDNPYFCGYSYIYGIDYDSITYLKKLSNASKYFPFAEVFAELQHKKEMVSRIMDTLKTGIPNEAIVEKLFKAGYKKLALEVMTSASYHNVSDLFDMTKSDLHKVMRVRKNNLKLIKLSENLSVLKMVQKMSKDIPCEDFLDAYNMLGCNTSDIFMAADKFGISHKKILSYIKKQPFEKKSCWKSYGYYGNPSIYFLNAWTHYMDCLKSLNYPMTKSYMFPADFKKEDQRITKEYQDNLDKIKKKEEEKRNQKIREISKALRNMKGIEDFMKGSKGLKVVVPESIEELKAEGIALHHCVGSYAQRVANGETSIIFIRKIEEPDKPYFTLEYRDGSLKQLHGFGNCRDKEGTVTAFATALVRVLQACNWKPPKLAAA